MHRMSNLKKLWSTDRCVLQVFPGHEILLSLVTKPYSRDPTGALKIDNVLEKKVLLGAPMHP